MMKICLNILRSEEVQQLMHSNVSYDLMVLEPSHSDALFGLAAQCHTGWPGHMWRGLERGHLSWLHARRNI